MRNTWLVIRREYLERVRTRGFILSTILVPAFMMIAIGLPVKLATMKASGVKKIVLVVSSPELAQVFQRQLASITQDSGAKFDVTQDLNATPEERDKLRQRVSNHEIDGFLWAPDDAIAAHKASYTARETNDFIEIAGLRRALSSAAMERALVGRGMTKADVDQLLKPLDLDTIQLEGGKENRSDRGAAIVFSIMMAVFLYTTLIIYGVTVMRSVQEEKSSRVLEVLLASVSPRALMAGKIIGVGAVGLTQVAIWATVAAAIPSAQLAMLKKMGISVNLPPIVLVCFPLFFVFGFLLNSAGFAAIGAAVNSEQEAQQLNIFVMMPMIFSMFMMNLVLRQPNAPVSVFFSLFPFTAPILMYLRIAVQQPPMWQIGLCIAILALTTWGMMALCARIYRVGILMYGKRPTLSEIIKWMRYA